MPARLVTILLHHVFNELMYYTIGSSAKSVPLGGHIESCVTTALGVSIVTPGAKRRSDRRDNGCSLDNSRTQGDIEMLDPNERDENLESYEEAPDMGSGTDELSHNMKKNLSFSDGGLDKLSDGGLQESYENSGLQTCSTPEVVKPCGRINSCMAVGRDILYIYGGMMEVRDREITLDDLYTLNLSKLDEWKCIMPASESEWLEVSEEDEDEDEDDSVNEQDSSESESEDANDEDDVEAREDSVKSVETADAVSVIKGEVKNLRRKEKRLRIEHIRANLGLSDSQRTPTPGESLRDFYKRTNLYWQMAAHEHTQHTGKVCFLYQNLPRSGRAVCIGATERRGNISISSTLRVSMGRPDQGVQDTGMENGGDQELRRDGFDLAESRYKELKPVIDELAMLEAEQKAEEQQGVEISSKKRGSKKNKSHATQR
ncbi:hypothetical protein IFM89_032830 [Coptis chinensis]|uniref:DUF4110 domain-containing protein n=1 Tax=Coptis chinensis TaxID=261450 RepID=A0A835LP68_9MAGN|nr:hypothetical protein IFM89_032830 [Coptis chinensis]